MRPVLLLAFLIIQLICAEDQNLVKRQFGGPILSSAYTGNYRYQHTNGEPRVQRPGANQRKKFEKKDDFDIEPYKRRILRALGPMAIVKRYLFGNSYPGSYSNHNNHGNPKETTTKEVVNDKRYTLGTSYPGSYNNDNNDDYPHKRYTLGTSYPGSYNNDNNDGYPHKK